MKRNLANHIAVAGLMAVTACAGPRAGRTPSGEAAPGGSRPPQAEAGAKPVPTYPPTRVSDTKEILYGIEVADPYRWLEDGSSPEVQAWMAEQDKVTRDYLEALEGREALTARLKELFYVDSIYAPMRLGDRYFYKRSHADREKAVLYWRDGEQGEERVLIDPNTLSADGSVSLGSWLPSWDGRLLAYTLKANNADEATLYVMDVASGEVSPIDVIEGAKYAWPEWTPQNDGFYYTWLPTDTAIPVAERPGYAEVRFHRLGSDPKLDPVVHPRTGNPRTFIGPSLSRDGRWLFVNVSQGWHATDVYYRDLSSQESAFKPLVTGVQAKFSVTAWKDRFYIFTDDGAPKGRLFRTAVDRPGREHWEEIIAEPSDAVIENVQLVGGHLALTYLMNASNTLEIRTLEGKPVRKVTLPGIGSTGGFGGQPDQDDAYFTFTSFTTPYEVYKTSIRSGETSLWARVELPMDPSRFEVEQVWYPSKDGTKVSMFIMRKKGLPKDGSVPFLLYGYGGFNVGMTPAFSSGRIPWLEAGGGYAVANLRGGNEYGEDWHRAGMLDRKQNTFDDFIAAAEHLVKEGYTSSDKLAIYGGSNGGLLVGAAMTQRPDLFKSVICAVPLLDMVRYHLFGSGKTWIPEYGSAEDEQGFRTLYGYSPYHHVKPGTRYPSLLMLAADHDDRVDPLHARKFTALLQAASAGPGPILMRVERNAGHRGADLVKKNVEQSADLYIFLMHELGLAGATPK